MKCMKLKLMVLFLLSAFAAAWTQESYEFKFLDGDAAVPGDSYYSQTLAFRFRNLARLTLPRVTGGLPREILCTFHVPPPDGKGDFKAEPDRGNKIQIFLPERFSAWSEDPRKLEQVARWTFLSRLGLSLEQQKKMPHSWVFAGIARRTASDSWKLRNLKFGRFPAAYALASHGIFPELKDILETVPDAADGFSRIMYEEWAQLLFEQCVRSGAMRKGLLEQYLAGIYRKPDVNQAELFRELFYSHLAAYAKKKFGRFVLTDGVFDLDKWFRREAERVLLSRFLPMSVAHLETSYRQAVGIDLRDAKGNSRTISIVELAGNLRGKPDLDLQLQLAETLVRLTELLYMSPPLVTEAFSGLIHEITSFRNGDFGKQTAANIAAAEKRFLRALEIQSLTENILKEAENRLIPIGERYSLSFSENVYSDRISDRALEILDHYCKRTGMK